MCGSPLHGLIAALPKCEHHIHIEGSVSPELLFELAERNKVALPEGPEFKSVEALYARYDAFSSLDDFLHYYYIGMSVFLTAADYEALAYAYFKKAHAAQVRHAEIFFDPQAHVSRGVPLAEVVRGLHAGGRRATAEWGITTMLIPCLLRHLPIADSQDMVSQLRAGYWDEAAPAAEALAAGEITGTLDGLGLCSTELDKPPTLWTECFAAAQKTGGSAAAAERGVRRLTAHAGEEGPAEYITLALDHLGAQRIDHGIAAARDPAVMARLARDNIMLTVCPLSNVRLKAAPSVAEVPIRAFLEAGVPFSVNSDDPAYFGGYIQENYCAVQEAHDLTAAEWRTITRNAVQGSWCDDARKAVLLAEIESVLASYHAGTLVSAAA